MTDLTDAVQTITSIMKSSTTGIGTSGYEITDDASSGLTIVDGEILVSYTISKEELKELFGGTQDYDIVITVKSGEIKSEYIGLTTLQYTEEVIITVNIIDKWSTTESNKKYITAHLVREKAINAIRKFVLAKVNPGGTINVWKYVGVTKSEDTTFKPTLYKAIIKTEAWSYYK